MYLFSQSPATNHRAHATQCLYRRKSRFPRVATSSVRSCRVLHSRTLLRVCRRFEEDSTQRVELSGWRRAVPSEVLASSNTNILSHPVFEREEASVCSVCKTGLLCLDCPSSIAVLSSNCISRLTSLPFTHTQKHKHSLLLPIMSLPAAEVAADFRDALQDLRLNSRPEISNLTLIAKENTEYAQAISTELENHIRTVSLITLPSC